MDKKPIIRYWYLFALFFSSLFLGYQVYQSTLFPDTRDLSFMYIEMGIVIVLLIVAYVMTFFKQKTEKSISTSIVFMVLIGRIVVMMYYASFPSLQSQIAYYTHMALFVSVTLALMMLANVLMIEKRKKEGFDITIAGKDGLIPHTIAKIPTLLIIVPIAFFIMLGAVGGTGSSFVPTPSFSADEINRPIISSVGVSAWEDYALIIIPMEMTRFIILLILTFGRKDKKSWMKENLLISGLMIIMGMTVFALHHLYVYGLNTIALLSVSMFGLLAGIIYLTTGLPIIIDALHDGNNFGAIYYGAKVFGLSTGTTGASGTLMNTAILFIPLILVFLAIGFRSWRRRRRIK